MAKNIVHKFKLLEISAVDRPAQAPARAVIMKRDENENGDPGELSPAISQLANALCLANPALSREAAVDYLLHSPSGRELFRLHKNEEVIMSKSELVKSLAKDYGAVQIAKHIIAAGNGPNGHALTEEEFTKIIKDYAMGERRSDESPDQAFARCFSASTPDGLAIRQAHAIVKNFPAVMVTEPTQVGGAAATAVDNPVDALSQLRNLAEEQRRRSPEMSIDQAFAYVYSDPANRDLAAKERQQNRPQGSMYSIVG
jgi:hypothetical protein